MTEYWLWLAHRPGLNDHLKLLILEYFGSPEEAYCAKNYAGIRNLTPAGKAALEDKSLEESRKILAHCREKGISFLTIRDGAYPNRLKNIYDPPLVLYYKGMFPAFDGNPTIGVVGTRAATSYGLSVAEQMGWEITRCGGLVVSGLAAGIDGAAMRGALSTGGSTVGVLGCGVDIVYPNSNRSLFDEVEKSGCLISEFPPGDPPLPWHFVRRNRIISGLSSGVLIVEAPEKSGALHTAQDALNQGRDIFAVPGDIRQPSCAGSNRLMNEGAQAVSCGWDVLRGYQSIYPGKIHRDDTPAPAEVEKTELLPVSVSSKPKSKKPAQKKDIDNAASSSYIDLKTILPGLSAPEQAIVNALAEGDRLVDEVIAASGLASSSVLSTLTMLEIRRILVRLPGNRIGLRSK